MKRFALLPALLILLALCACTGPEPEPTAPPVPVTAAPAPTAQPTPSPTPSPTPTPAPVPEADAILTAGDRDYPAYRFSGDLTGSGEIGFSCLLPAEEVTAAFDRNAWVFRLTEAPEAFLEISFIMGGDVESLLPGFLDGYLDFTEIEFSEGSALGRLRGEVGRVSAAGETRKAEGWLLEFREGTLAAALVCPADAPEAESLLLAVLDTLWLD